MARKELNCNCSMEVEMSPLCNRVVVGVIRSGEQLTSTLNRVQSLAVVIRYAAAFSSTMHADTNRQVHDLW